MTTAFHGGAFWEALDPTFPPGYGERDIVVADVLDAWFPPAPGVIAALGDGAERLARTSPPTHAEGLIRVLSERRGIAASSIAVGAGSSDLLYRALPRWIGRGSRVLLPEPTYGEYAHLIETVLGARVDRFPILDGFEVAQWEKELAANAYDLAVLVNPNNPTATTIGREEIVRAARRTRTRLLVDEAYMDYLDRDESVQCDIASLPNLVVVRSLSKGLALSGLRAAYLVASPNVAAEIRALTPPWNLSGPAQIGAIRALEDPDYYAGRYAQTITLRRRLATRLCGYGLTVREGINWVLAEVEDAAAFVAAAQERGAYIRDAGRTAPSLGDRWVRIAVGDEAVQDRLMTRLFPPSA